MTFKPLPSLQGERITLRAMTAADAPAMFASLNDEEAMRLTGTQDAHSLADVEAHLEFCERSTNRCDFAIIQSGKVVGEVVLNDIDSINRNANFRISVWYPENRDKGHGSEATRLILEFGFEVLRLHRIELEVFDFNPRARHVYEQSGFVYEGTRRDALFWEDEWVDAHLMAILRTDFLRENSL